MNAVTGFLENLGGRATSSIHRLGFASRFLLLTLQNSGMCLRRFSLVVREIYSAGVLSLIIILVSGLFVGMVLGLQGSPKLERYNAFSSANIWGEPSPGHSTGEAMQAMEEIAAKLPQGIGA